MSLRNISTADVSILTRILQLLPTDDGLTYSNRVLDTYRLLSPASRRPNLLTRLLAPTQLVPPLCALHRPLDAGVIHALFQLLALEVGVRLNRLVAGNERLSAEQWGRVARLRMLHSLWLPREVYEKTFCESADDAKHRFQPDGCEACTLARVAGDLETLLDLRLVLYSRYSRKVLRKRGPAEFTRWVQGWISSLTVRREHMGDEKFEAVISRNDKDAKELRKVRKILWFEKRAKEKEAEWRRKNGARSPVDDIGEEVRRISLANQATAIERDEEMEAQSPVSPTIREGPTDHDAENSIIDHYATLMSTPHLPCFNFSSLSLVSPKTKLPRQRSQLLSPTPSSAYSQSMPTLHLRGSKTVPSPETIPESPRGPTEWTNPEPFENETRRKPAPISVPGAPRGLPIIEQSTVSKGVDAVPTFAVPPLPAEAASPSIYSSNYPPSETIWTDASVHMDSYVSLIQQARGGGGNRAQDLARAAAIAQRHAERQRTLDALLGSKKAVASINTTTPPPLTLPPKSPLRPAVIMSKSVLPQRTNSEVRRSAEAAERENVIQGRLELLRRSEERNGVHRGGERSGLEEDFRAIERARSVRVSERDTNRGKEGISRSKSERVGSRAQRSSLHGSESSRSKTKSGSSRETAGDGESRSSGSKSTTWSGIYRAAKRSGF